MEESVRRMIVRFVINSEPRGKQRPRVFNNRHTGKSQTITPKETVSYENLVRWTYANTLGCGMLEGALRMDVMAYYSIPKSTPKGKRQDMIDGKILHTKRGDIDNVIKLIADALNGIAYKDDGQIAEVYAKKMYSENPRVEVTIQELD